MIFKTISETIRNQKYTRYDLYGMFFFKFIGIFFENLIWLLNYVISVLKICEDIPFRIKINAVILL